MKICKQAKRNKDQVDIQKHPCWTAQVEIGSLEY